MLHSLLTSSIMQDDNLVINESYPIELPTPSGSVGEILSGHWARRTHAKLCNGKDDMLVPLILYINKTHTEEKGVNNVEPVCFTLGIFKKSVQMNPEAWHPLGYINNTDVRDASSEQRKRFTGDTMIDFHTILKVILRSLVSTQQKGGVLWDLEYKGKVHRVNLKLPICVIIGDAQGQDKLCAKYGSNNVDMLCRSCDCTMENADNPFYKCQYKRMDAIKKLFYNGDLTALAKQNIHNVENAFFDCCFGDNGRGIYGATPFDTLHTVNLGLYDYAKQAFFSWFTDCNSYLLNQLSKKLMALCAHQSERDMPRLMF